jgi:hypothetical protein
MPIPQENLICVERTGRMPIPQENLIFVEQSSCLFLRMMQDLRNIQKSAIGSCCTLGNEFKSHRASLQSFVFRTVTGFVCKLYGLGRGNNCLNS